MRCMPKIARLTGRRALGGEAQRGDVSEPSSLGCVVRDRGAAARGAGDSRPPVEGCENVSLATSCMFPLCGSCRWLVKQVVDRVCHACCASTATCCVLNASLRVQVTDWPASYMPLYLAEWLQHHKDLLTSKLLWEDYARDFVQLHLQP